MDAVVRSNDFIFNLNASGVVYEQLHFLPIPLIIPEAFQFQFTKSAFFEDHAAVAPIYPIIAIFYRSENGNGSTYHLKHPRFTCTSTTYTPPSISHPVRLTESEIKLQAGNVTPSFLHVIAVCHALFHSVLRMNISPKFKYTDMTEAFEKCLRFQARDCDQSLLIKTVLITFGRLLNPDNSDPTQRKTW
jgi:hypothetical protein